MIKLVELLLEETEDDLFDRLKKNMALTYNPDQVQKLWDYIKKFQSFSIKGLIVTLFSYAREDLKDYTVDQCASILTNLKTVVDKKKPIDLSRYIKEYKSGKKGVFDDLIKDIDEKVAGIENKERSKNATAVTKHHGSTRFNDPVYVDDEVEIYRGDDRYKCAKYGRGYSYCISSWAYWSYRMKAGSTFYFIFFKETTDSDPDHTILINLMENGKDVTWANADNRENRDTLKEVVNDYPSLIKPYNEGVFTVNPLTSKEKDYYNKFKGGLNDAEFLALNDEEKWIYINVTVDPTSDDNLTNKQFEGLNRELKNNYINLGIGLTDRQYSLIQHDAGLMDRYKTLSERVFEQWLKDSRRIQLTKSQLEAADDMVSENIKNLDINQLKKLMDINSDNDELYQRFDDLQREEMENNYDSGGYRDILRVVYDLVKKKTGGDFSKYDLQVFLEDTVTEEKLNELFRDVYIQSGYDHGYESAGYVRDYEQLINYSNERDDNHELENALEEFMQQINLSGQARDIILGAIGPRNLETLMDDHNLANIYKYALDLHAKRLNDPKQMIFTQSPSIMPRITVKPQEISIRNINDIIYILDKAGYDNITNFIRTAMKGRINERHNKYKEYFKHI